MTRLLPCLFAALLLPGLAAAQEPSPFVGSPTCRVARLEPAPWNGAVKWSGQCKDGYAEGPGTLDWSPSAKSDRRLKGTLVRGELQGEGTLAYELGTYTGTLKNGVPHGKGFFEWPGKSAYEGAVRSKANFHIPMARSACISWSAPMAKPSQ